MKHSNLLFLVAGVIMICSGCAKDDLLHPEFAQSDQVTNSLKSAKKPSPNLTGTMESGFADEKQLIQETKKPT